MFKSGHALLLVIALLFVVGCSQNEESSPFAVEMDFASEKSMANVSSEIALCLDVSEYVSAEELQAAVNQIIAGLGNPDLVAQDGRVAVGGLVYGTNTAYFLDGMIPVTPENLTNVINPALTALAAQAADRLVPTDGVDLAGALTAAHDLLAGRPALDKHILMIGSGVETEGIAVAEAFVKIHRDGIMNSALLYKEISTQRSLLEGCVDGTGGYFQNIGNDLPGALAMAFKYMLRVEMTVTPFDASVLLGGDHTVSARVFRGGDPEAFSMSGQEVTFTVYDGPNTGITGTVITDDLGQATFTYTGAGELGTDRIAVATRHPKTGETFCDLIAAAWMNSAPVLEAQYLPMFVAQDNHKYITVTPDMVIERAEDVYGNPVDLAAVSVISVSSDELEDTIGDGSTMDDILIECPNTVMLRTERMGGEQGRVYTIHYRLTDANGTTADDEFRVVIVKDNSESKPVVFNRGAGYTVTSECETKEYHNQF